MAQEKNDLIDENADFLSIHRGYINAVKIGHGLYEFQLILSNTSMNPLVEKPQMIDAPQFVAQMSPQHFKILARMVVDQVKKYEDEFGTIQVPDSLEKSEQ